MNNYSYKLAISSPSPEEAEKTMEAIKNLISRLTPRQLNQLVDIVTTAKMPAIAILASRLTREELDKMAHIMQNDPIKTELAKRYLGL